MIKKILYTSLVSVAFIACTPIPDGAYYNRASPESLLDVSTESVNTKLRSPASVQEVIDTINKKQPTRAELKCVETESLCKETMHVLHQFAVPYKYTSSRSNSVSLVYEYTMVRNCQNRYIDITTSQANIDNLNYPTFGCSVAINIVQHVTDKREFTDPALMGHMDATKPLQAISNYDTPPTQVTPASLQPLVEGSSGSSSSR